MRPRGVPVVSPQSAALSSATGEEEIVVSVKRCNLPSLEFAEVTRDSAKKSPLCWHTLR